MADQQMVLNQTPGVSISYTRTTAYVKLEIDLECVSKTLEKF